MDTGASARPDGSEWAVALADGRTAHARCTTRAQGDLAPAAEPAGLAARRRAVVDLPWVWLRQVHGADVVVVADAEAGARACGTEADASVTAASGVVLAVQAADCGPVALVSPEGVVGAAHAGWRGTAAGVLEATAEAMRSLGASRIEAVLFPCLHVECCEFGPGDLDRVADRLGPGVRGRTAAGRPALDLPAAVAASLDRAGVGLVAVAGACTACDPAGRWFSHRARGDVARHALAVWIAPERRGADQVAPERRGADQVAPERRGADQVAPERRGADQVAPERRGADQVAPGGRP